MAEEVETSGAGPRIENAEDFAEWLKEARPAPNVCVSLAARAALRALPFVINQELKNEAKANKVTIKAASRLFRATETSLSVAMYPRRMKEFLLNLYIALNAALAETASSDILNTNVLWSAVNAAKAAKSFYTDSHVDPTIYENLLIHDASHLTFDDLYGSNLHKETFNAVRDATNGILLINQNQASRTGANRSAWGSSWGNSWGSSWGGNRPHASSSKYSSKNQMEKAIWFAVELDVRLVLSGTLARRLADIPLWHGASPPFILDSWDKLALALPDADNWWVWKNWYEDILSGRTRSEAHDMIYATVPIEEWDKGPAAANKWIAERLAELGEQNSLSDTSLNDFPKPLDDVPSPFTLGLNEAGQIDIVAGPQNTPVIAFAGDETTHRQWLDTARELARRLIADLRAEKFGNVRRDYLEGLERYADDLPTSVGEGNFLLADHEIIAIHHLFGAEAAVIPETLAARLNRILKAHYSLLDFYPETERYHEAARKGRLGPPVPEEAFASFRNVIREFTPEKFAPSVLQELEAVHHEAPIVEIDEEDKKLKPTIEPAPYPFGFDILRENRLMKYGVVYVIYNFILYLLQNPDKMESWVNLWKAVRPHAEPLLRSMLP